MCMKMDLAPDVGVTLANVEAESINLTDKWVDSNLSFAINFIPFIDDVHIF